MISLNGLWTSVRNGIGIGFMITDYGCFGDVVCVLCLFK